MVRPVRPQQRAGLMGKTRHKEVIFKGRRRMTGQDKIGWGVGPEGMALEGS